MEEQGKVKIRNLVAYGVGDIYGGGSFLIISLLFMYFLTDTVGLPALLAGLVMLPGKVWDAISDPMMGYLSDTMKTRYGRRRIFFLIGVIPVAVTFVLLWVTVHFDNPYLSYTYYATAFILFRTAFTMVMVPYSALNAEMSMNYKERMRLSGARMIFSQGSSLICAVVPKLIIDRLYAGNPEQGFLVMSVVFGIFFAIPWIFVFLGTWEIESAGSGKHTSVAGFFRNIASLFKNKSFRIHMGMYIAAYSALDILMAVYIYYLTHYMGKPGLFATAVGAMLLTQMLVLPFYVFVANRKGKGFSYILGLCIWGTAMMFTYFINPSMPTVYIVLISVFIGSGMSAGSMIPYAILPSVTDVDEIISAEQRAGSYAGAMTFLRKIVNAFVIFIFGIMLELIGYQEPVRETVGGVLKMVEQTQSALTLMWLKNIVTFAPLVLIIAGILVALKFKITPGTHAILVAEIKRLKEGGLKEDADPETIRVCEELTGQKYADLYPLKQVSGS